MLKLILILALGTLHGQGLLDPADFKRHVQLFNTMETEEPNVKAIPNAQAWEWMEKNIPFFESASPKLEEIYYYRWWTYRKHITTRQKGYPGYVLTEFINWESANSSAYSHHLAEGRWLRDKSYLDQYTLFWYRNGGDLHKYSQWSTHALYHRYLVNLDKAFLTGLLDDLVKDYVKWESEKKLPSGLFWQYDVRDAMEESISGSRTEMNIRPTINSYMAAEAKALAEIAKLAGRADVASRYQALHETSRKKLLESLWDAKAKFFKVRFPDGALSDAREAIGFIPWMFGLPGPEHSEAWLQIRDAQGFKAPMGLTTAERRHPKFRANSRGPVYTCEWDGPIWPFATSQTLNALAILLRSPGTHPVDRSDFYSQLLTYARAHVRDGKPYLGEYQDDVNGTWLREITGKVKGDEGRSRYYNHSTFCDLVIGGLVGLVPRGDDIVEVDPLVPKDSLAWFALDRVAYHGKQLSILWDRDGSRYGRGAGLKIYADNRLIAQSPTLARVTGNLNVPLQIRAAVRLPGIRQGHHAEFDVSGRRQNQGP